MLSHWSGYIAHQTSKSLDRFWLPVFDGWYQQWPITLTPAMTRKHGSCANAERVLRKDNNKVSTIKKLPSVLLTICAPYQKIHAWFHNCARTTPKTTKASLRLHKADKRKLAPAQAYCTYAWDSGLKEVIAARWKQEKQPPPNTEEDDSATESADAPTPNSIPIHFKIKIAKEVYDALPANEKKKILNRIKEDHKKMYQPVRAISDLTEKDKKLFVHEKFDISSCRLWPLF